MSYLKLAWIPRTQPARDDNPYVPKQIKWEVNRLTQRAKELLALEPVYALMDEAENDPSIPTRYSGTGFISYSVDSGDEAKEILAWWRERGYRSIRFRDETYSSSRAYVMGKRDDHEFPTFDLDIYFTDGTCKFVDKTDENGQKIVDRVLDSVPAQEAVILYQRELICGDSLMPDADELEEAAK